MILNSPYITGSVTITGNANIQGTIAGAGVNSLVSTASYNANSSSVSSRITTIENSYATTGSNTLVGTQNITNTTQPTNFDSTAAVYTAGGLRVKGNIYASSSLYIKGDLTVYGTQSINYITSSQLDISDNIINVNTAVPGVRFGGIAVYDSGSTGLTGSLLWDSQNNKWIYSNPSGSSYDGGMAIFGPRNSSGLGSEQGTTNNALMKGQGGDHITSSLITEDGNLISMYSTMYVSSSGYVGIGTTGPQSILDIRSSNLPRIQLVKTGIISWYLGDTQQGGTNVFSIGTDSGANYRILNIDNSGYVGIGTSSPNAYMHLYMTASQSYPHLRLTDSSVSGNGGNVYISADKSGVGYNNLTMVAYSYTFKGGGSATSYLTIDLNGNVGIGNTSPNSSLSFANTTSNKIDFYNDGTARYTAQINSGELRFYTSQTSDIISLYAGNTVGLVNKNGSVGIGTTSPDTKLHLYNGGSPLSIKIQRTSVPVYLSDVQTDTYVAGAVWSHNKENVSNGSVSWGGAQNTNYGASAIMLNSDTTNSYITFHTAASVNTTPTERFRIFGNNGYSNAYKYIGNLASTSLSSLSSAQIQRWYFDSQCNNTWRTVISSINQRHFFLRIWGSDAGTYNYGEYYFTMSFPGYGVSNSANYHYTSGGWNTGGFELTYTNTGSDYYLQIRNTSYYSSTNNATFFMEITAA